MRFIAQSRGQRAGLWMEVETVEVEVRAEAE